MAQDKTVREAPQYNAGIYIAGLALKNAGIHFCTLVICLYSLARIVLSVAVMICGGSLPASIIPTVGLLLLSAGSVCALIFSRYDGSRLSSSLVASILGTVLLLCAGIFEMVFLKTDVETACQIAFLIASVVTAFSLLSAARGNLASTVCCYILGFSGLSVLVFAAVSLVSVGTVLRPCFASSYNWGFLAEDVDDASTQIKWYFIDSNITVSSVKTVFFARFIERLLYLFTIISVSITALKIAPYINREKRSLEFAQEIGDFSAFDGNDFRSISKKRTSENVKNQSYYGIGSLDRGDDKYDTFENEAVNYKTNEYGDYLDGATGIFYYYDANTGKYYYLDESSGQYVYRQESHKNTVTSEDAMPWELSHNNDSDEDDIYNY